LNGDLLRLVDSIHRDKDIDKEIIFDALEDALLSAARKYYGTKADIAAIAQQVEDRLAGFDLPITVAVMGCEVNGPGEAADADVGIAAAGDGMGTLFRRGEVVRRVPEAAFVDELLAEVRRIAEVERLRNERMSIGGAE
jgi:hypothetical protein